MSAAEERSLGDLDSSESVSTIDSTQPVGTPADFDMDGFLLGARPTRRSVKLYPRGDLVARMEELAKQIQDSDPESDVDDLIDEFVATRDEFNEGVWFTVERRSIEWVKKFRTDMSRDNNLKLKIDEIGDMKAEKESDRDKIELVVMHQLVEQIVVPARVTYEQLRTLAEINETEVIKLIRCMHDANRSLAESAEVMTLDFSRRRSNTSQG